VEPDTFEFWEGRENRLHDRVRYRRTDDGWAIDRLAP
jgi:pyridoxamine 5'-phosphate oxidase